MSLHAPVLEYPTGKWWWLRLSKVNDFNWKFRLTAPMHKQYAHVASTLIWFLILGLHKFRREHCTGRIRI
jgi:hypothetical protein